MNSVRVGTVILVVVMFGLVATYAKYLNADDNIAALIDQLSDVGSPDTGYSQFFSGSSFLPYEDSEQLNTFILGATARERSPVMRKIVEAGFDAVPDLLKHIGDERKVKLPPIESGGMMWIAFSNEYDFNAATATTDPKGVNLDIEPAKDPARHEITVGDLCFVALGQIVNRQWSASRYQPTGGRIISSPTFSQELRQAILDEWSKLDRETHRKQLIEDFRSPDSEDRFIGALERLSFFYPEEVEKLVLELLSRPIADSRKADEFAHQLMEVNDSAERKRKLHEILGQHGQYYRDSLQAELFIPIKSADEAEIKGIELNSEELLARKILHETFDWPKDVKYKDWIKHPKLTYSSNEMARMIETLTHDDSVAIGDTVKSIMESDRFKDDGEVVIACLTCLSSRLRFGDYLAERLEKIDFRIASQADIPGGYLTAIAQSQSPSVQFQLRRIVETLNDPQLFYIAAERITKDSWDSVLQRAKDILKRLPPDTKDGRQLLQLIVEKAPGDAELVLTEFLKPDTPSRCDIVCVVLWNNNPLSQKVLLPLLDDKRSIPGVTVNVRDRAAQAISHSINSIRFDSDWPKSQRDEAIRKIKEYCQQK